MIHWVEIGQWTYPEVGVRIRCFHWLKLFAQIWSFIPNKALVAESMLWSLVFQRQQHDDFHEKFSRSHLNARESKVKKQNCDQIVIFSRFAVLILNIPKCKEGCTTIYFWNISQILKIFLTIRITKSFCWNPFKLFSLSLFHFHSMRLLISFQRPVFSSQGTKNQVS